MMRPTTPLMPPMAVLTRNSLARRYFQGPCTALSYSARNLWG
jgi:hypothetical protein